MKCYSHIEEPIGIALNDYLIGFSRVYSVRRWYERDCIYIISDNRMNQHTFF